jgi:hypothetical protein
MLVSILAGHLFQAALRDLKIVSAAGFLLVSCAATWGIVYTSVANQSQITETNIKAAENTNEERALLLVERKKSTAMLDEERKAKAKECSSGDGTRCAGLKETVRTYERAVEGIQARLDKIGPEVPVQVKADKMASLIAALCNKDQSVVKRFLLLIEPFTYSLIFEVCALVSFSYGFSHPRPPKGSVKPQETVTNGWHVHTLTIPIVEPLNRTVKPSVPSELLNRPVEPSQPSNSSAESPKPSEPSQPSSPVEPVDQRRAFSKDEALAALLTDLALGRGFGSQDELAERFNRPKSTISVWLKDWTRQGLIPNRTVRGRCKAICP